MARVQATAIGANNQAAQSILKQDYKEEMSLDEALELGIKVLSKTMDSTSRMWPRDAMHPHAPHLRPCYTLHTRLGQRGVGIVGS